LAFIEISEKAICLLGGGTAFTLAWRGEQGCTDGYLPCS